MTKSTVDRRTFTHNAGDVARGDDAGNGAAWAQGKKRNVVIGHTGITWPARAGGRALGLGKVDLPGVLDLMDGRKLEGMIMVELDSGGQMPYTPREAAQTARNFLIAQGVTMKA